MLYVIAVLAVEIREPQPEEKWEREEHEAVRLERTMM